MAVAVPYEVFSDESFQESLAAFLEQASIENVKDSFPNSFSFNTDGSHRSSSSLP
jgi:hypothetical protein